ncbi:MAG: TerB family tellurite resistance protein [Acetobacteraceae bacterium]
MSYWGKVIGGFAGLVMGGPFGAVMGAALGHAADQGAIPRVAFGPAMNPARLAAMLGGRDQLFAIGVVVLSAKLAKCDGPVVREEIDAFKRQFRIPPTATRDVGRLFDQARDSQDSFEPYAQQLGESFADAPGVLEDVLGALFAIARADKPINGWEMNFLERVHTGFRLSEAGWDRARGAAPHIRMAPTDDAYAVLGVPRSASNDDVRQAWRALVRANHPDSLAARGVPAEFIASATNKVAGINAAWDLIKRERGI